jgi:Zn finger protein HypA/HybF involved in hydrogenase expression
MKEYEEYELHCRQCGQFLDSEDLIDGECPNCETDEDLFENDINDD